MAEEKNNGLRPLRCARCGRFLALEAVKLGIIHIKCPNCKNWAVLIGENEGEDLQSERQGAIVPVGDGRP